MEDSAELLPLEYDVIRWLVERIRDEPRDGSKKWKCNFWEVDCIKMSNTMRGHEKLRCLSYHILYEGTVPVDRIKTYISAGYQIKCSK